MICILTQLGSRTWRQQVNTSAFARQFRLWNQSMLPDTFQGIPEYLILAEVIVNISKY